MGLDYDYKIYIKEQKLKKAINFIFNHCEKQRSNLLFDNGEIVATRNVRGQIKKEKIRLNTEFDCCLIFPNDNKIWEYHLNEIADGYELDSENVEDSINLYQVDSKHFWIGNIEIRIKDYSKRIPETVEIRFLAVTTRMSELFRDSPSIDQFFKNFCKEVGADYGCLDKETEGYKLIWYEGEEKDYELKLRNWETFDKFGFIPTIRSILKKRKL